LASDYACRYLIIKLFPNFSLQVFFNLYFWLIGSVAVAGNILPPLRRLVSTLLGSLYLPDWCLQHCLPFFPYGISLLTQHCAW